MIKEKAYAKINLILEVKDKMPNGYHEIKSLMAPIDLFDEIELEKKKSGISLDSNINIKNNFMVTAAKLFLDTYKINEGVSLRLKKNIPIQAGLAGGSADASAVLRGLNKLFNLNITNEELRSLSSSLGSDMPYCIEQKLSICSGRGEKVQPLNCFYKEIPITIIKPEFGLSTKSVYENYIYIKKDLDENYKNVLIGLQGNNISLLEKNILNDLESSSLKLCEEYKHIYDIIQELGYKVFQSGSGPSLFILGENNNYLKLKNNIPKNTSIIKTKILCRSNL